MKKRLITTVCLLGLLGAGQSFGLSEEQQEQNRRKLYSHFMQKAIMEFCQKGDRTHIPCILRKEAQGKTEEAKRLKAILLLSVCGPILDKKNSENTASHFEKCLKTAQESLQKVLKEMGAKLEKAEKVCSE